MDFVTAAANLRMYIFSMNMKSRFDVKCECACAHTCTGACASFPLIIFVYGESIFAFDGSDFTIAAFFRFFQCCVLHDVADRYVFVYLGGVLLPPLAMAGNIIPAIATTNAVIAGLIVLEALKILNADFQQCRTVRNVISFLFVCLLIFRPCFSLSLSLSCTLRSAFNTFPQYVGIPFQSTYQTFSISLNK